MASNMDKRLSLAERKAGLAEEGDWFGLGIQTLNGDEAARATLVRAKANPASSYHAFWRDVFRHVNEGRARQGLGPIEDELAGGCSPEVEVQGNA